RRRGIALLVARRAAWCARVAGVSGNRQIGRLVPIEHVVTDLVVGPRHVPVVDSKSGTSAVRTVETVTGSLDPIVHDNIVRHRPAVEPAGSILIDDDPALIVEDRIVR